MEGNQQMKVTVNASEIISRLKSRQDRKNFCQEMNWHSPNEPGYDLNYFLKVIMGEKRYLPTNFNLGYKLKYFKKGITLNKKYIISKMLGNPAYALYTPDNINIEKLSRDFLLKLVAYIDPALYKTFYSIYKDQSMERNFNKWQNYTIDVQSDIMQKVKQFIPIDSNKSRSGGFQLTKNHIPNNTFKEGGNINIAPNQSKQGHPTLTIKLNTAKNDISLRTKKNKKSNSMDGQDIEMENNVAK